MESKQFLELVEAYSAVYAPREVEEEVESWVNGLIEEGYDLSEYTWDDMYEIYVSEAMTSYEKNRQRAAQRAAARNEARKQGKTGNVPGVGYVSPRPERETWRDEGGQERHKTGARMPQKEEYDIFEVVLEFLCVEGYAETLEEAEWMMANVIDEEAIDIILGEGYKPLPKDRIKNKAKRLAKDTLSDFGTTLNPFKSDYEKDVAKHNMRKREKRVNKMVDALKTHKETRNEEYMDEEQLDEISQKTATRAFASRATHDFESDGADDNYTKSGKNKTDETKRRIEKKFGAAAGQHAERAAHRKIFGRGKEGFTKMPPKPTKEEFVGEAQEARNNPEKYEREQSKKYAPVRGEKTPMPPRGNKRREDFEKWYAANVR
jgi:hypothetical protein